MNKQLHDRIRMLNFIMTCVIVVYHASLLVPASSPFDDTLRRAIEILATLAMGHFFAVTGFLLFRGLTMRTYGAKLKRRVFSLLVPYLLWQLIELVFLWVRTGFSKPPIATIVHRVFLLSGFPANGALWYLYAIFLLALGSPILLLCYRKRRSGLVMMLVLAVGAWLAYNGRLPFLSRIVRHGVISNITYYFPAFAVGAYFGRFYDEEAGLGQLRALLPVLLVFAVLESVIAQSAQVALVASMGMLLIFLCPVPERLRERRIYDISFLIYAIHQPRLSLLCRIAAGLLRFLPRVPGLVTSIALCAVLAIIFAAAAILNAVLKRFAPRALGVLTGGRFS